MMALAAVGDLSDSELMQRVQADDPEAFGALYERFSTRAYHLASAIARDGARVEDVVQDAFVAVWRSRAQYEARRGAVISWVMGAVRHRATDPSRPHARHDDRRADGAQLDEREQGCGDVEETAIEGARDAQLRGILARLPETQRDVIALAYFGQLSASEIADVLALPLATVKGRMRHGLKQLRG